MFKTVFSDVSLRKRQKIPTLSEFARLQLFSTVWYMILLPFYNNQYLLPYNTVRDNHRPVKPYPLKSFMHTVRVCQRRIYSVCCGAGPLLFSRSKFWGIDFFYKLRENIPNLSPGKKCTRFKSGSKNIHLFLLE